MRLIGAARGVALLTGTWFASGVGSGTAHAQSPPPKGRYAVEQFLDTGFIRALDAGDMDHDGRLDFVTAIETQGKIGVVRNLGYSRFDASFKQSVAPNPRFVTLGDFDHDGHLDVIAHRSAANEAIVLRGDGTGKLGPSMSLPTPNTTFQTTAADLDGDGDEEAIVTAGGLGLGVAHWTGTGFGPFSTLPLPGSQPLEPADVDGDGFLDVVTVDGFSKKILIHRGNGAGGLLAATTISTVSTPGLVLPRDLQGDGIVDLVVQASVSTTLPAPVETRLGVGGAVFSPPVTSTSFIGAFDLGDVDLDGDLDLMSGSTSEGGIGEATGGPGVFQPPVAIGPLHVSGRMFADADSDGWLDVVVTDPGIGMLPGRGTFSFPSGEIVVPTVPLVSDLASAVFADANADGVLDLVSYSPASKAIVTRLVDSQGNIGSPVLTQLPANVLMGRIRVTDFDVDGWEDILALASGGSSGVASIRGTGQTQFVVSGFYLPGVSGFGLGLFDIADVDRDGDVDVVGGAANGTQVGVMPHLGFGVFGPAVVSPVASTFQMTSIDAMDQDGDGWVDLALVHATNPTPQILLMKGQAGMTFTPAATVPTPAPVGFAEFAKLNGDATPDLVAYSRFGPTGAVMSFSATGPFQYVSTANHAVGDWGLPTNSVFTDVDRDGIPDFAVVSGGLTNLVVARVDAAGVLQPPRTFAVPGTSSSLAAHDIDVDGRVDFVVAGFGDSIWMFRGQLDGDASAYGIGCAGTGGIAPELWVQGTPHPGESLTVRVRRGLGGAMGLLVFGAAPALLPIGGGSCSLLTSPLFPIVLSTPLAGVGAGQGEISFAATVPPGTPEAVFGMQVLVADPGGPGGVAVTNAVSVAIQH